jgi:predicted nucleic acid-binding protein
VSLVLDASVTVAWFFEDERTPPVVAVLDRVVQGEALVPPVWRLEVVNALQSAVKRGRIVLRARGEALEQLEELAILCDETCDTQCWGQALALADLHGLTIYDATYLELATRRRLPLATLDQKLRRAAEAEGLAVLT